VLRGLSKDIVHGITSLDASRATGAQLLALVRDHWIGGQRGDTAKAWEIIACR
jgi:hypothetical protein